MIDTLTRRDALRGAAALTPFLLPIPRRRRRMPIPISFTLPPGATYPEAGPSGGLSAGQTGMAPITLTGPPPTNVPPLEPNGSAYTFPDLHLRPRGLIVVERIYLPVLAEADYDSVGGKPPPTVCNYILRLEVRGQTRWSHGSSVSLSNNGAGIATGTALIDDDMVNPFAMEVHDTGSLFCSLSYDHDVQSWQFNVAMAFSGGVPVAQPGELHCEYVRDEER